MNISYRGGSTDKASLAWIAILWHSMCTSYVYQGEYSNILAWLIGGYRKERTAARVISRRMITKDGTAGISEDGIRDKDK